jgi:hypothetical protein
MIRGRSCSPGEIRGTANPRWRVPRPPRVYRGRGDELIALAVTSARRRHRGQRSLPRTLTTKSGDVELGIRELGPGTSSQACLGCCATRWDRVADMLTERFAEGRSACRSRAGEDAHRRAAHRLTRGPLPMPLHEGGEGPSTCSRHADGATFPGAHSSRNGDARQEARLTSASSRGNQYSSTSTTIGERQIVATYPKAP